MIRQSTNHVLTLVMEILFTCINLRGSGGSVSLSLSSNCPITIMPMFMGTMLMRLRRESRGRGLTAGRGRGVDSSGCSALMMGRSRRRTATRQISCRLSIGASAAEYSALLITPMRSISYLTAKIVLTNTYVYLVWCNLV